MARSLVLFGLYSLLPPLGNSFVPPRHSFPLDSDSIEFQTTSWSKTSRNTVLFQQAPPTTDPDEDDSSVSSSSSFSKPNQNVPIKPSTTLQEQSKWQSLTRAALGLESSSSLTSLELLGTTTLVTTTISNNNGNGQLCLVVGQERWTSSGTPQQQQQPALIIPLIRDSYLQPLEAAVHGQPVVGGEFRLLRLNANLVNRDNGLWDNVPWSSWTVDTVNQRNIDGAGNVIAAQFHMGKRDAYNVMMGKDWFTYYQRSTSSRAVSSLAQQLRTVVSASKTPNDNHDKEEDTDRQSRHALAMRLVEFQIREVELEVAELDYQLAVARVQTPDQVTVLEFQKEEVLVGLQALQDQWKELVETDPSNSQTPSSKEKDDDDRGLMERILKLVDKRQPAPYRGATGYAPYQGKTAEHEGSPQTFTSSYQMLANIMENQLKAQVIGCVLENTSLLDGTVVVGGALVLQRQTAQKQVSILGQAYTVNDEEQDYGNPGITGGETIVVECQADEAIGMSLVCPNLALQIETNLWEAWTVMAEPGEPQNNRDKTSSSSSSSVLEQWRVMDTELSLLMEGQARNTSATERVAPIRVPRTATSLYDTMIAQLTRSDQSSPSSSEDETFSTDNPVKTLSQLDSMTNSEKAQTLLSMSTFQGRLPRPRTIRQAQQANSKQDEVNNPLDELLLPRIDESVRRQYRIRQAQQRGDTDLVQALEQEKSSRQQAQEAADTARALGQDQEADRWQQEAELLESLRADVTQDEGSYSRFLDRDEWYERERQKTARRANKKKFGTLLDGIE